MEGTRRGLLAALGVTALGSLAGCQGNAEPETLATRWTDRSVPSPLRSVTLREHPPAEGQRRIRVAWDAAAAVHVTGYVAYGSPNCDRVAVTEVRYEGDADRLVLRVGPTEREWADEGGVSCSFALERTGYRVTARFAGALPETVRVVEESADPDAATEVRAVDRPDGPSSGSDGSGNGTGGEP